MLHTITPQGPFSLHAAAGFGFGPTEGQPATFDDGCYRLAFGVDGGTGYAGAVIRQPEPLTGPLNVQLQTRDGASTDAALAQIARILSLDHDGDAFLSVGRRDPAIAPLQAAHPGQRPVLFHSPYEAAAWGIISARLRTARQVRTALSAAHGESFELAGQTLHAFPQPERLAQLTAFDGLSEVKVARLRALARAALEGELDPARIQALGPEAAYADLQRLPGIGPYYTGLVTVRASGFADAILPMAEPKVFAHAQRLLGLTSPPTLDQFTAHADAWRPFRTWTTVLIRLAGERRTF